MGRAWLILLLLGEASRRALHILFNSAKRTSGERSPVEERAEHPRRECAPQAATVSDVRRVDTSA
jgi:hypothetical protein